MQEKGRAQASSESKALPGSDKSGSVTVNSLPALHCFPLPFMSTRTQTGCAAFLVDIIITLNTTGLATVAAVTCTQGRLKPIKYTCHWFPQPHMDSGEHNMHCTKRNTYSSFNHELLHLAEINIHKHTPKHTPHAATHVQSKSRYQNR